MAEQVSLIQFKGKLGQTVGFRGRGKNLIRERVLAIANPQTEAQMAQRARFKLTSQLSAMLGVVGRTALRANGFRASDRGELNKMIMPNVISNTNGEAEHEYILNLIKNPYTPDYQITATLERRSGTGTLSHFFTILGVPEETMIAKTVMLYNKATGKWRTITDLSTRNTINITLQESEASDQIDMFGYAVVIIPVTSQGATILNNIKADAGRVAESKGFLLAANRLDSDNFAYTRVLCTKVPAGTGYSSITDDIYPAGALPQFVLDIKVLDSSNNQPLETFEGTIEINNETKTFVNGAVQTSDDAFSAQNFSNLTFDATKYELQGIEFNSEAITLPVVKNLDLQTSLMEIKVRVL